MAKSENPLPALPHAHNTILFAMQPYARYALSHVPSSMHVNDIMVHFFFGNVACSIGCSGCLDDRKRFRIMHNYVHIIYTMLLACFFFLSVCVPIQFEFAVCDRVCVCS